MTVLSLEESNCKNTKLKSSIPYQINIHIKILRVGYVVLSNYKMRDEKNEKWKENCIERERKN